jgi:hypothetical protein
MIAWQLGAYLTGRIPNHILPLVHLLSGTQEAIPVAYMWTLKIGVLSVLMFIGSLAALCCLHILRRRFKMITPATPRRSTINCFQ